MVPADDGDLNATIFAQLANLDRLTKEAADLTSAAGGNELALIGDQPATVVKTQLATIRATLAHKQAEIKELRDELEASMRGALSQANALLAPLREKVKLLEEAIWTVNLYTGRDEEIITLADGEAAAADTPIVVRQLVLSMDQETTINADGGGIDANDIEAFDAWLTVDPAHLAQVLPEPKGVVVLVPRITAADYGDAWSNDQMRKRNTASYWLIRNGDKLFRMHCDFAVGTRLVPTRDEFTAFFRTRQYGPGGVAEWVTLEPGTRAWLDAEKASNARQRHYMRVALILQGLLDRTPIWHPLPDGGVSFLTQGDYDAGKVVLRTDDEMAISTGRVPFYTWLADLNAQLRVGMRVIGAFGGQAWRHANDYEGPFKHSRVRPVTADCPAFGKIHVIEERKPDGGLVIRYQRGDTIYPAYGPSRTPKTRASATIYPGDKFIIPLDLVDEPTMVDYMNARTERHAYLDMLPLLKEAIAAKRAEADAETPMRQLLAGQLIAAGVDAEQADAAVPELVTWWKLANKHHRALVAGEDRGTEAKAIKAIVAEHFARTAAAATARTDADAEQARVGALRDRFPDAVVIARTRDGGYLAGETQPRSIAGLPTNIYLREHTQTATGRSTKTRDWVMLTSTRVAKWRILWQAPAWAGWNLLANPQAHLTDPQMLAAAGLFADLCANRIDQPPRYGAGSGAPARPHGNPVVVTYNETKRKFYCWLLPLDLPELPERGLLTSPAPEMSLVLMEAQWRKGAGNQVMLEEDSWVRFDDWSDRRADDPWTRRGGTVVWRDDTRLTAGRARRAKVITLTKQRNNLAGISVAAKRSVHDGWLERAKQQAYTRFLEDYLDPSLWEGHVKTLRFQFPYHFSMWEIRELAFFDTLIDAGHQLSGLTVAQAAQLCENPPVVPDDLADLVISTQDS